MGAITVQLSHRAADIFHDARRDSADHIFRKGLVDCGGGNQCIIDSANHWPAMAGVALLGHAGVDMVGLARRAVRASPGIFHSVLDDSIFVVSSVVRSVAYISDTIQSDRAVPCSTLCLAIVAQGNIEAVVRRGSTWSDSDIPGTDSI